MRAPGSASRAARPAASKATIRRRRAAAVAAVALLIAGGVGLAVALSGGSAAPRYNPPGGQPTLVGSGGPALHVSGGSAFKPAASAVAAAARMSLAQQVGQLFMVSVSGSSPAAAAELGGAAWGGVVLDRSNFSSIAAVGPLAAALQRTLAAARVTAPLIAAAQEGGPQTAFPGLPPQGEAALGAQGRVAAATAQALAAGRRLRALGIGMTLAPLADVDIPTGAFTGRLFSQDPAVVARFTAAALTGYRQAGEIAAVGHFPGVGAASADPETSVATVGGALAQLRARDLIPFAAVAPTAPAILMSNAAYAAFDGVTPASVLPAAVKLLRDQLHFQGVVMSDDLDATLQPTALGPGAVAVQALQAGDDLLYITGPPTERMAAYQAVLVAAQRSSSVRAQVREAVLRVLTLKARYGLLPGTGAGAAATGARPKPAPATGPGIPPIIVPRSAQPQAPASGSPPPSGSAAPRPNAAPASSPGIPPIIPPP